MKFSLIIPLLNERENIITTLPDLQWFRQLGHELIVVDGGSHDDSVREAEPFADLVVSSPAGRSRQMNAGASHASGDYLLFLHIDTTIAKDCIAELDQKLSTSRHAWGHFDVLLSGRHIMFRIIESMMNLRSRLSGIATGDQLIFVSRDTFQLISGYADIPLMEDIEICRRLKRLGKPLCLSEKVMTSSRRWEMNGIMPTIIFMWRLRFSYWLGTDPRVLAKQYYG